MSADKYFSIFPCQMEAIVYIFLLILYVNWRIFAPIGLKTNIGSIGVFIIIWV